MIATDAAPLDGPLAFAALRMDNSSVCGAMATEKLPGACAFNAAAPAGFNALIVRGAEIISASYVEAGVIGRRFKAQKIFPACGFPALCA